LELAQQRGLVAAQQRALAALRQQARDAETRIAVLLGQPGLVLFWQGQRIDQLRAPPVGAGLPSQLLLRRPDIARAEAQLARADADVAVARAAMLPSITLSTGISAQGDRFGNWFDSPLSSLAAGLTAPIFNAGRLAGGRDLALAQREELLAAYRASIVSAFADVSTALNAVAGVDAEAAAQAEELAQAQHALALAESRYRAGADSLLTLLDAQRTLYTAQDQAVSLRHERLQASVALCRALGGGWQAPVSAPG
jgi:NodT family efflux transporter outer membrane factor (OMF) lipoprotein